MPAYPNFVGGSNTAQSPIADGRRLVNFYIEPHGPELHAYPTPGVTAFATSNQSPGRGHFSHRGLDYAVIGAKFGQVTIGGAFTEIGTVASDQYPATFATNGDYGDQILISSGNNGYVYDLSTLALTLVRTGATRMVAHLDGFGLALDVDTSTLYVSDNGDFTVWDPTMFAQRSTAPDPWVALKVVPSSKYAYLLGAETSEAWYDAGTAFPFAPHPSGLMQYGCGAPFSAQVVDGSLTWLTATKDGAGFVVAASGFTPEVISTFAVSAAIGGYAKISDAIGDAYQDLGHSFYILTFPSVKATWAYDATASLDIPRELRWAERSTWIVETLTNEAWRPLFHTYCFGKHLMLDLNGGTIYQMSSTLGLDVESRPIRRVIRPAALFQQNRPIFVSLFELLLEPGLGLVTGQGSDPKVALRISKDGGKTWGSERLRRAGALGQYDTRVRWFRNGQGRRWMPEVVMTDGIPWRVLGALIETKVGGTSGAQG